MSTQKTVNEGSQTTENEGSSANEGQISIESLQKRIDELASQNARLLDESKKYKEQATQFKSKASQIENEVLTKEGDLKKILEKREQELSEANNLMGSMKRKVLMTNIRQKFLQHAQDAHSIDDLMNQPAHFKKLLDATIEDELTVPDEAVKNFVETVYKEKPFLRRVQEQPSTASGKPQMTSNGSTTKELASMTTSDIEAELKKRFS